jgi:hypothetical protein
MSKNQLTAQKKFNLEELIWLRDQYNAGVNSKHREHSANKVMAMVDDLIETLKKGTK